MYTWSGCDPDSVTVNPAVCVNAETNAVRVADVAAGECGCEDVVLSADVSAMPPLAYLRRNPECETELAGKTDAFSGVRPGPSLLTATPPVPSATSGDGGGGGGAWGDFHVRAGPAPVGCIRV